MSDKTKKIINIVVDVVVTVILILVLILAIGTIVSKKKGYDGYTEIFGRAYVAVASDSMACDYETKEVGEDNFSKGDLIVIKTVSQSKAMQLEVGDIITYRTNQITEDDTYVLNTHRIIYAEKSGDGNIYSYTTHGDNNPDGSNEVVLAENVVGVYVGKASGIGNLFLFMKTSAGFFTCVVVPSLIIVLYFAVNLVLVILKEKKVQTVAADEAKAQELELEREKAKAELLAELQAQGKLSDQEQNAPAVEPTDPPADKK